ncbi:hypothetical protein LguiB_027414 [Lonicera macranthoides]
MDSKMQTVILRLTMMYMFGVITREATIFTTSFFLDESLLLLWLPLLSMSEFFAATTAQVIIISKKPLTMDIIRSIAVLPNRSD